MLMAAVLGLNLLWEREADQVAPQLAVRYERHDPQNQAYVNVADGIVQIRPVSVSRQQLFPIHRRNANSGVACFTSCPSFFPVAADLGLEHSVRGQRTELGTPLGVIAFRPTRCLRFITVPKGSS